MDFKLLGSIWLIVGTSIGAGMLALPTSTSAVGFIGSSLLLIAMWCISTYAALLLLEANLWMPQNSNLMTMARRTIGPLGQFLALVIYLLLLNSLLSAYISGGSDLLKNILHSSGLALPPWGSTILFTLFFSTIVFFGIRSVDYANRILMTIKFTTFFLVIISLVHFISPPQLLTGQISGLTSNAIVLALLSFGYSTIIPSLRVYFAGDVRKLKICIIVGSLIPLLCYIAWNMVVMGIIPLSGPHGLLAIFHANDTNSELVNTLSHLIHNSTVSFLVKTFTSICVVTSFISVGICLSDFWADTLGQVKAGWAGRSIHVLTFLPPLIVVLFFPNAFMTALEYGGLYCLFLLLLLPTWIVWNGRYKKQIAKGYRVLGGKAGLMLVIVFAIGMALWTIFNQLLAHLL